jgi:hypothetical protein
VSQNASFNRAESVSLHRAGGVRPFTARLPFVTVSIPMRSVLGTVDHFFGFVLHLLDYLFDLVLCVANLLFGLASLTIGLAFGFKVLVADKASDSLFGLALNLLALSCHRVHLSWSWDVSPHQSWLATHFPLWRSRHCAARGIGPRHFGFWLVLTGAEQHLLSPEIHA